MMTIDNLVGISIEKRIRAIKILDSLLAFKDKDRKLKSIISGYNIYDRLAEPNRIITFSHIHETESYKIDMLLDLERLGYNPKTILKLIRDKAGNFLWNPNYRFRDSQGRVLSSLRIKDLRTGDYV